MDKINKDFEFIKLASKYSSKNLLNIDQINQLYILIKPIINSEYWLKYKNYPHHNENNRGMHIMGVCFRAYYKSLYNKRLDNSKIIKIVYASMLHDAFDYDWKLPSEKQKFFKRHAFVHGKLALEEAKKYFPELLDEEIENAILSHMWPLTKAPKYKTGWIVKWADLYDSLEVFKNVKELPLYLGIKRIKN